MKTICTILFCLLSPGTYAQTIIKLHSPVDDQHYYTFVNPHDSAYVCFWCMQDMGVNYGQCYMLKLDLVRKERFYPIPDGEYDVYVDDTLEKKYSIKAGKENGAWVDYYKNGQPRKLTPYKDGKITGEELNYYPSGKLACRVKWRNDYIVSNKLCFYESGKIASILYYDKNSFRYKEETFNEKGKRISRKYNKP